MSDGEISTGFGGPATPQFRRRLGGYDRDQVDDYVAQLRRFLADAEARAAEAYALATERMQVDDASRRRSDS